MQENEKYLLALNHFTKFGPVRLQKLKNFFSSWQRAWLASRQDLLQSGIEEKIIDEFISFRSGINPDNIVEKLNKEKINILILENKNYPPLLKEIYNPPPLLYYRGTINNQQENIAFVGSRKNTLYGKQVIEKIIPPLAQNNYCIVSGLAFGIDALAHQAALDANDRTVAVLATGLDKQSIYPSANRYLADKIIMSGGMLISEFPPGTPPLKHHFPQRNRIISGLSVAVVIIEAQQKSGALITARHALEQNREIFAVPGNILSSASDGTNNIIKQGAKPITAAEDIIETLDLAPINNYINTNTQQTVNKEEKILLSYLSSEPIHINELIRKSRFTAAEVNAIITLMEIKGLVKNLGNMLYVLS